MVQFSEDLSLSFEMTDCFLDVISSVQREIFLHSLEPLGLKLTIPKANHETSVREVRGKVSTCKLA